MHEVRLEFLQGGDLGFESGIGFGSVRKFARGEVQLFGGSGFKVWDGKDLVATRISGWACRMDLGDDGNG